MKIELTDKEVQTLIHCLHVAAEIFGDHADVIEKSQKVVIIEGYERLARQFDEQAIEALALVSKLEGVY